MISITGIGGIGKTALADAVVRDIIKTFYYKEIIWLRIHRPSQTVTLAHLITELGTRLYPHLSPETPMEKQRLLIRQRLAEFPHLIIIDNIETRIEKSLLDHLRDLADPSKFLLTSRISLPEIRTFSLTQLSIADMMNLIHHQTQHIGLADALQITIEQAQSIYEVVGGNPLAIKLDVGLMVELSLTKILADLQQVQLEDVEALYRHIYWHAWRALTPEGRTLLRVMPLASTSGTNIRNMAAISGLAEEQLRQPIKELTNRCLLETRGTAENRAYSIHRLTESFLLTEIIHWPDT